jgi:CBS domain containing-hemolysin-like protein
MVVLGELLPKYLALEHAETLAKFTIGPTLVLARVLSPLVWLAQTSASSLVKVFGITAAEGSENFQREELLMLVRAGKAGGGLDHGHADFITRTLKLDALTAKDIMVHRLDMRWLDIQTAGDDILPCLAKIPHSRIPVCKGDIDDLIGIVYVHDVIKNLNQPKFDLRKILRPAVTIPENLTLDRIVTRMRDERTQILIVMDEYGGTSGLITLEDVVEEVFGELEDSLEGERPPVEIHGGGRVTARADVRFDELIARLGLDLAEEPATDTLAEMIVEAIERVPRIGDSVETPIGKMRVDNMARRRITRVSLKLQDGLHVIERGS